MLNAKLRIVGGGGSQDEIRLMLPATVGRGQDNDITLVQPLVSRHHCEISSIDDQLWVRDLGSLNGTFVGSKRIEADHPLKPGELLTIGTVTFRALYGELLETDASGFLRDPENAIEEETIDMTASATVICPQRDKSNEKQDAAEETSLRETTRAPSSSPATHR